MPGLSPIAEPGTGCMTSPCVMHWRHSLRAILAALRESMPISIDRHGNKHMQPPHFGSATSLVIPPSLPRSPHITCMQAHRTQWGTDPLARGSYSFPAAATQQGDQDRLAEPLVAEHSQQPLVLFAGEATHAEHYGTAHGAYMSGEREAERLLAAWQLAPTHELQARE